MSRKPVTASKSLKFRLSSDWGLQLDPMKSELLVMANQQVAVNTFSGLVHTARRLTAAKRRGSFGRSELISVKSRRGRDNTEGSLSDPVETNKQSLQSFRF